MKKLLKICSIIISLLLVGGNISYASENIDGSINNNIGHQFNVREIERANEIINIFESRGEIVSLYDFLLYSLDNPQELYIPEVLREISWEGEAINNNVLEANYRTVYYSTISRYGRSLKGVSTTSNNYRPWHVVACYIIDSSNSVAAYSYNSIDVPSYGISAVCIADPPSGQYRTRGVHTWPATSDMGDPGYVVLTSTSSSISYVNNN